MANPKRQKIKKSLNKIPEDKFGKKDILSLDLAERVGRLEGKSKITIRLDARVIEKAKQESEELGVGYQKIINDKLLEVFAIQKSSYLESVRKTSTEIEDILKRLQKLEEGQEKFKNKRKFL